MRDETSDIARTDTVEYWETCAKEAESENGGLQFALDHWIAVANVLKRQRNIAEAERDDWRIRAMQSEQQRQSLRAERDALRKDAARYRYLRQGDGRLYITPGPDEGNSCGAVQGAVADQAIDAAMEAK
jgi:hypothetical protein